MVTHDTHTLAASSRAYLAQFDGAKALQEAVAALKSRGYRKLEAFSPFPIHGIDETLGIRPTPLGWMVLAAGLLGGVGALALQWWTNAVDYPFLISGKPRFSLPANIPVTFEVVILAGAFAAFFGMLLSNGLPRLANPIFRSDRFRRVTTDGFFLLVEVQDSKFRPSETLDHLTQCGAMHVELLTDHPSGRLERLPRAFLLTAWAAASFMLIPPLWLWGARTTLSDKPRIHNFFDMDFQPKFKPQTRTTLFDDQRAMRPRVEGTVPWGAELDNAPLLYGTVTPPGVSGESASYPTGFAGAASDPASHEPGGEAAGAAAWVTEIPLPATEALMRRGQQQFNVFCATCHGKAGDGSGLVSQRALALEQGTWVPPTSLHADHVREQPDGQLYNTTTHGVRKMPGYGHQISVKDRWAIVLYVRALQRSQQATLDDVPEAMRPSLRELN